MSVNIYDFTQNPMTTDSSVLIFGMGLAMGSILVSTMNQCDSANPSNQKEEILPTTEATRPDSVTQTPLDDSILELLRNLAMPLTARQLTHLLEGVDRSEVNSRLYTMLCKKKIKKNQEKGAPLWFV